jgi:RNA polymerase sigma-70 factor, ECF subfamily
VDTFLEEWMPRLYRFALRLTGDPHAAEDLAQETMLRAWRQRDALRDSQAIRVWLFRIAANHWRDQLRRLRSPIARAGPLFESALVHSFKADQVAAGREELQLALEALADLPPRQREVLYLSACEGLKTAEIGQVLGITPESVKASLSIARKRMRENCALAASQSRPSEKSQ